MKIIPLLLIVCLTHFGYSQKSSLKDSIIKKEVIAQNDSSIRTSKTIIQLEDAKTIFKEKKNDWWDKYSSGLIAALTVLVSLGISVLQARSSHKHTKANIISEARVEWIQKLRPHMGQLISDISQLTAEVHDYKELFMIANTNELKTDLTAEGRRNAILRREEIMQSVYKASGTFNQVRLFLNRNEVEHVDFINSVENFLTNFNNSYDLGALEDDLAMKAQIILKNAWEQAKGSE